MSKIRSYSEKDVKRLITSAGGRCSFNHRNENCKRLLINNNSVIGEKAHIVAIGTKGPRHDPDFNKDLINSYDNLMWLCPTHHTMIDKMADVEIYTTSVLLEMKEKHEKSIANGNVNNTVTIYDTLIHDYSSLSTLFEYVDINKLYSSSLDLPYKFDHEFLDLSDMLDAYEEGNGKFSLQDQYLNKLFVIMIERTNSLWDTLTKYYDINPILEGIEPVSKYSCVLKKSDEKVNINWVKYWICEYQQAVDIFLIAMKNRYPEIFIQPLYEPFESA